MNSSPHKQARDPNDFRLGPRRTATMLVFLVSWLAVVGGFYLWRGSHRSKADLGTRLQDNSDAKTMQDAAIELAARMKQHDAEAKRWYPALLTMARSDSAELRGSAAWIMANDPSSAELHQALLKLAGDDDASVRANAAVSLAKFKDPAGRRAVLEMLRAPGASSDEQWEALRALRTIGTKDDLPLIASFENSSEERIREAAEDASQGIRDRI